MGFVSQLLNIYKIKFTELCETGFHQHHIIIKLYTSKVCIYFIESNDEKKKKLLLEKLVDPFDPYHRPKYSANSSG